MKKGVQRYLGAFLTLAGFLLILSSSFSSTGFAVASEIPKGEGTLYGFLTIVGGLTLLLANFGENMRVTRTSKFEKAVKSHHSTMPRIERAIDKIGTGSGNESKMKYDRGKTISVPGGGVIRYDQQGNEITLTDYLPSGKRS